MSTTQSESSPLGLKQMATDIYMQLSKPALLPEQTNIHKLWAAGPTDFKGRPQKHLLNSATEMDRIWTCPLLWAPSLSLSVIKKNPWFKMALGPWCPLMIMAKPRGLQLTVLCSGAAPTDDSLPYHSSSYIGNIFFLPIFSQRRGMLFASAAVCFPRSSLDCWHFFASPSCHKISGK